MRKKSKFMLDDIIAQKSGWRSYDRRGSRFTNTDAAIMSALLFTSEKTSPFCINFINECSVILNPFFSVSYICQDMVSRVNIQPYCSQLQKVKEGVL